MKARQNLGDILSRVALRHDEFIIERDGRPMAAVVPVEKLEQMKKAAREFLVEIENRPRLGTVSPSQADSLANEAKHKSRPHNKLRK